MKECLERLRRLHTEGVYPQEQVSFSGDNPIEEAEAVARSLDIGDAEQHSIAESLVAGYNVYNLIQNMTPAYVPCIQLPVIDPDRQHLYLSEGQKASMAFRVLENWRKFFDKVPPDFSALDSLEAVSNSLQTM